jgi:CubicO group peptidase (beta-lactamase class C family)
MVNTATITGTVSTATDLGFRLQKRLDELVGPDSTPGASLAFTDGNALVTAAAGVTSIRTGVGVDTATLFQIGSITKVYTATLVMQLVDEGLVELDSPVVAHLQEFSLADRRATEAVTVRHLLSHTSGIDAELADTGRADDCIERFVALLRGAPVLWAPGTAYSYCNAGFIVLGRLLEVLRGDVWDRVLEEHLLQPLQLAHSVTLPEQAILFRAAAGHEPAAEGIAVASEWMLPRSCGPAGLVCATASDVVAFATLHLAGGLAPGGRRVLSEGSIAEMGRKQAEMSFRDSGAGQGLGWGREDWNGKVVLAHGGGTRGQLAYLHLDPASGVAAALLTNGPSKPIADELMTTIFRELAGIERPAAVQPDLGLRAAPEIAGTYAGNGAVMEVVVEDGGARARWTAVAGETEPIVPADAPEWVSLAATAPRRFAVPEPRNRGLSEITFTDPDEDGRPTRVYVAGRAANRVPG